MTLYFHIGFHKTGSSAIQEFMHEHREFAETRGIRYPAPLCKYPSHGEIAWAYLGDQAPWRDNNYDLDATLDHYYAEIDENEAEGFDTVLSNEDISLLAIERAMLEKFAQAFEKYRPCIIAYVRDPVDYIFSSYHHAVVEGHTTRDFEDWFVVDFHADAVDFRSRTEQWETVFGKDAMIIREYSQDAIEDFLELFDMAPPRRDHGRRVNAGIHPWYSDSYRRLPPGDEGQESRQVLITASGMAKPINNSIFYLGNDATTFNARFRDPYDAFMQYANKHYRQTK